MPRVDQIGSVLLLGIALGTVAARGESPPMAEDPAAQKLIELGERIEARVGKLRGLAAKKPIRWEMTTKERVRAYLSKTLAEQYEPGELEREGLALTALGLIPPSLDFAQFVPALLLEQVGGYYDPKLEVFYLADWIAPGMQEPIIAHELTHALQDQHFDLDRLVKRLRGNSDAMVARAALVEGEATLVMMLDAMRATGVELDPSMIDLDGPMGKLMMVLSVGQFPEFAKAPRTLREMLVFPYLRGLAFVMAGRQRGGWERIDRVYADLPVSSEQVLHPEKYFVRRDPPTAVKPPSLEGLIPEGWEPIYEDVLGELVSFLLLEPLDDREEERRAAAGWDGDRYQVFRRGESLAWVGLWVFDSQDDAIEFAGAFAKTVPLRHPGFEMQTVSGQPRLAWKHADGRAVLVAREKVRVLVADGFALAVAERVRQAALGGGDR